MALEPGRYPAKIKDYGFSQPKKEGQNPSAIVIFEVDPTGPEEFPPAASETITWFGSFNGGAKSITLDTLLNTLGFNGKTGEELVQGSGSNVLREDRVYEIEVEMNTWEGKTTPRVKYINIPGETRRAEKLDAAGAKVFVGGMNLAAELVAMRAGKPSPTAAKPARPNVPNMAPKPKDPPKLDTSEEVDPGF